MPEGLVRGRRHWRQPLNRAAQARPFWWPARARAINGLLRSSNERAHSAADLASWDLRFSPGRLGAAQRASVPETRAFVGKPQHRAGFGAFQAALRESIMSILAGAILHAGPMRSAGQHGFKDEHGAGGLGEEKRNPNDVNDASLGLRLPIHENSSALGQYPHPWGCVYHYVRFFVLKTKERASAPSRRPAAARTFRRLSAGLDTSTNCILPHGGVFVLFSLESRML